MRKAETLCAVLMMVLSLMAYVALAMWVIGDTPTDLGVRFLIAMGGLFWGIFSFRPLSLGFHKDVAKALFEEDD